MLQNLQELRPEWYADYEENQYFLMAKSRPHIEMRTGGFTEWSYDKDGQFTQKLLYGLYADEFDEFPDNSLIIFEAYEDEHRDSYCYAVIVKTQGATYCLTHDPESDSSKKVIDFLKTE